MAGRYAVRAGFLPHRARLAAYAVLGCAVVAALLPAPAMADPAGTPAPAPITDTPSSAPATPLTGTPPTSSPPASSSPTADPSGIAVPSTTTHSTAARPGPKPHQGAQPEVADTGDADSCGGTLILGTPAHCPAISDREVHTWTFTTTVDGERLVSQFEDEGDDLTATLRGPDGDTNCNLGAWWGECVAATAGTYTVVVGVYNGSGTGSYRLGIDSRTNPSSCREIPAGSFGFPTKKHEGTLPAGSAGVCLSFVHPVGATMRVAPGGTGDIRGQLENAAGDKLCELGSSESTCTLEGAGPFRIFLTEMHGNGVTYHVAVTRLSDPEGCTTIPLARLGGPDGRTADATAARYDLTCQTFTAQAGPHLFRFDDPQHVQWRIVDGDNGPVCTERQSDRGRCTMPAAGTYTLFSTGEDGDYEPHTFRMAIYPLGPTDGCAAPVGTSWDTPTRRITVTDPLQVDCHLLDARPGERIDVQGGWITDGSSDRICDTPSGQEPEYEDGCVLPGSGPYRIISEPEWQASSSEHEYPFQARRLNDPQGCTTVAVGRYGAAPAGPETTNRCRVLTVPGAGTYRVEFVDGENSRPFGWIYDRRGLRVCGTGLCTFPAAGEYTLVTDGGADATVFLPGAAAEQGCVAADDRLTGPPQRGEFRSAGQYDCLLLPSPKGSHLAVLRPQDSTAAGYPEIEVYDADGEFECDGQVLRDGACPLDGVAPFHVLLYLDYDVRGATGPYVLGFARTDGAPSCPVLPRGSFDREASAPVTLAGDRFAGCFSLPAGQHSAAEVLSVRRTAGTGLARIRVFDADGTRACRISKTAADFTICHIDTGAAMLVVEGTAAAGTYALSRKDVTGSATGCRPITSTVVGGPSIAGTLTSGADVQCYAVTADVTDRIMVDSRDPAGQSMVLPLDAAADDLDCAGWTAACSVTGRTRYQVLAWSNAPTGATGYQLDVWKVWAKGKPAAECTAVPSPAYGFGPYTGTLSNAKPALCLATTRASWDDLSIDVRTPNGSEDDLFGVASMQTVTASGARLCTLEFTCWSGRERVEVVAYLLTIGDGVAPQPFRLDATCAHPYCGGVPFAATSVSPTTLPAGGVRTFTLHGTSLHQRDAVSVTPAGRPAIRATVTSVAADRRTATITVDLTTAPTVRADVSIDSYGRDDDEPVVLTGALTVVPPSLRATTAPTVTGAVAVGRTVRATTGGWSPAATSYAYRWTANGATIAGATGPAYTVGAGVVGKRLTVVVTAKRTGYLSTSATSATSAAVAKGAAPRATRAPSITGTAKVKRVVRVSVGVWSPKATSYRYEWRINGKVVRGATGTSLKLTSSMRNKKLTVTVVAPRTGHLDGRSTSRAVTVRR